MNQTHFALPASTLLHKTTKPLSAPPTRRDLPEHIKQTIRTRLRPGEKVAWRYRATKTSAEITVIVGMIVASILLLILLLLKQRVPLEMLLAMLYALIWHWVDCGNRGYVITNQRIFITGTDYSMKLEITECEIYYTTAYACTHPTAGKGNLSFFSPMFRQANGQIRWSQYTLADIPDLEAVQDLLAQLDTVCKNAPPDSIPPLVLKPVPKVFGFEVPEDGEGE